MRTSSLDEINKRLQDPKPIKGGLITDPLPLRLRELEERVKRLEKLTTPSAIRTVAQS